MHKLTKNEIIELDNYWNFINIFKPEYKKNISWINNDVLTYRKYIIKKIRENYTIEQFYLYEKILHLFTFQSPIFTIKLMFSKISIHSLLL
jgi:hypothetical protein